MKKHTTRAFETKNSAFQSRIGKYVLFVFSLIVTFSSCVPNRRLVYLQNEDLNKVNPYDTTTRTYNLKKTQYLLKPQDVVTIRVASITDDRYDFLREYETQLGIIRKLDQYSDGKTGSQSGNRQNQNIGLGGNREEGVISALSLDRLNSGFVLDLKGELELPYIGKMKLSGLTIPEAEFMIRDTLRGYFETPMVRIQLLNYHFTILGEVSEEGRYTSYDPEINVFDAFLLAGNLTEFADRSNIKIIRKEENGEAKIIYLNTLDESTLSAENFYLRRDDLIIVPPLNARVTNKYTLPNIVRTLGIVSAAISLSALIISLNNRR